MKILIFTSILPFPLDEGGKTAQFIFLQSLSEEHEVVLAVDVSSKNQDLKKFKAALPDIKFYLIEAEEKTRKNRNFFTKVIEKVIWNLRKLLPEPYDENGLTNSSFFIQPVKARSSKCVLEIEKIAKYEKPDLVQVDFIDNADLAIILSNNKKIIILHDLRFSSVYQAALINNSEAVYSNYLSEFVKTSEMCYLKRFDGLITFSEDDAQRLRASNLVNVFVSPFAVADRNYIALTDSYKVTNLVFLGPEHHHPNFDALRWYAENLSQAVYNKFNLKLTVFGNWTHKAQQKFGKYKAVEFVGYVEDLRAAMQSSVMLVPLRIGSGIRTKILEAFAMGVPVISTSVGIEGIGAENGKEFLLADNEESFLEALQMLLNSDVAQDLRISAQRFAKEHFSQQVVYKNRMDIYKKIIKRN